MNSAEFKISWERHKAAFRQEHPQLTDEDLAYEIGEEGKLLERLQQKVGKNKEEIHDWLRIMG